MPRQYSQYYLRKKSLKPIGFYKKKVRGKRKKVTVPIMPHVARRRVHVASVFPRKKPSVIKRKTVLPRDVMEERIISISRTHLGPMAQQNLQDNLRKANDEKVEELYKYWSKQGKKKEAKVEKAKVSIPKGEPKYGDEPIATYVNQRSGQIFDIYPATRGGFWERQRDYKGHHISGATQTLDEMGLRALEDAKKRGIIKVVHGKLPEPTKEPQKKAHKIVPKPKKPPTQKMTHIERMHLLAACKKFELDPQEIDNEINYYENKKHLQELASEKGFSEAEITSGEQEQEEWVSQFKSYLNQLKGELESAGYEVRELATL